MASTNYLTRDAEVLEDILAIKRHIFENYFDYDNNVMKWLREDNGHRARGWPSDCGDA